MNDILPELNRWIANGESIALATVIQTWGSSPRGVGAKMGITASGKMTGSVSGGCVEGAVIEAGLEVIRTRKPQLLHFGVADETAWQVGLACGGTIDVFVQPLDIEHLEQVQRAMESEDPFVSVTVLRGPEESVGEWWLWVDERELDFKHQEDFLKGAVQAAREALHAGQSQRMSLPGGNVEVFAEVVLPSPLLIIVGGVHISIALAKFASILGFQTAIVDPRRAFGSPDRFAHADQLIQAWPDEALERLQISQSSAIAVLTHDPKLDDPALMVALNSPAFYVGALGSKTTQAKRRARLLKAGLTEAQLDRLHGPIGLAIGAKTPEEIALSIMGEIVALKNHSLGKT